MIFREKLLKKYSLKTIYKTFVEDLKKLETGVEILFPLARKGMLIHLNNLFIKKLSNLLRETLEIKTG